MNGVTPRPASCLHLVLSARKDALEACRASLGQGDAIFFLADGVLVLLEHLPADWPPHTETFYSHADLQARGLLAAARDAAVTVAHDPQIAPLLRHHRHCLSWK